MSDAMTRELNSAVASARRSASSSMAFLKRPAGEPRLDEANAEPVSSARAKAAAVGQPPSVISAGAEFCGSIAAAGELQVQGTIRGDVRCTTIIVCAGGKVEGDVIGDDVHVHGAVRGRIFGKNVRICAGADVVSDIRHSSLGIDPAADFEGSVKRVDNPLPAAEAPAAE